MIKLIRRKPVKLPDPSCLECMGEGFVTRDDGGAGGARICACRLPGGTGSAPPDTAPQGVRDLEALASSMEGA